MDSHTRHKIEIIQSELLSLQVDWLRLCHDRKNDPGGIKYWFARNPKKYKEYLLKAINDKRFLNLTEMSNFVHLAIRKMPKITNEELRDDNV